MSQVTIATNRLRNCPHRVNQFSATENRSLEMKKSLVMQWRMDEQSKLYCQWLTDD